MNEQRAREGVEHLQAAALEVIAAVRAFLDIAEDVVRDPAQVAAVVQGFAETAKQGPSTGGDSGGDGVTRIRVS